MQSYITIGTKSSTLPVSLTDLKAQLPVTGSTDDTRLTKLEWKAVDFIERQLNRCLVTTSITETYPRFPSYWDRPGMSQFVGSYGSPYLPFPLLNTPSGVPMYWQQMQRITFHRSPVQSITSVSYYDANNALQTLTSGTDFYACLPTEKPAFIEPLTVFPISYYRTDAVSLIYSAGYSTLPPALDEAICLLVGAWIENREDFLAMPTMFPSVPIGVQALIQSCSTGDYY